LTGLLLLVAACAIGARADPTASPTVLVTVTTADGDHLAFDPAEIAVPARAPVRLTFRNGSSLPHNLVFTTGIEAATDTIVEPGESQELAMGSLAPGVYRFVCTIHQEMSGALTAGVLNAPPS
jgi:plastocyanin